MTRQRSAARGPSKAQQTAAAVARAVSAGRATTFETVDFDDPNRPKTCLEVDFPILPVNEVAQIEGNAGKPVYQLSKWWARRRSSVFRSMLIAGAMRAPDDHARAGRAVWDAYYGNHQANAALGNLRVADIFMGGGTTVIEGSRLGMNMYGNDLNPVAWFVTKTAMADVRREEVEALLRDIEAEVKPQVMPFYACNGPDGERGTWTHLPTKRTMGPDFDPLALTPPERHDYSYVGPEIVYIFWGKHGPCQVTGCGHRTPLFSSPVIAVKTLTVKAWLHTCRGCRHVFDIEEHAARMAPDVPLVLAPGERPYVVKDGWGTKCPRCGVAVSATSLGEKQFKKKVNLFLLVHPAWQSGEGSTDPGGLPMGGSATSDVVSTSRWLRARASVPNPLLEIRVAVAGASGSDDLEPDDEGDMEDGSALGAPDEGDDGPGAGLSSGLPPFVICPHTGARIDTAKATIPKRSHYTCEACGTVQDVMTTIRATGMTGPVAPYAVQAYSPARAAKKVPYGGRYFLPVTDSRAFDAAQREWDVRKHTDLADYWPKSELPYGFMTSLMNGGIPNHGFTHWHTMFNARQLLVNALLLKAINEAGGTKHRWDVREYVLAGFQQYLRNQNMFTIWNPSGDKLEPLFANNNFHPKSTMVENGVFATLGRGNWATQATSLVECLDWREHPWEVVGNARLRSDNQEFRTGLTGKSTKVMPGDPVQPAHLDCVSSTDLSSYTTSSFDLVITDPPFGGLLHYSELSDFFHVWLRLVLKDRYPDAFGPEYTPKTLEAVANRARNPGDADARYKLLLTEAWREAHRILKPGGTLAFTFHHSEDEPWVAVLESLFEAGFHLEATYPIRSDETKGQAGEFGSKKIEYDIIHVCRKRIADPSPVSWARMRREVLRDVNELSQMLEVSMNADLPDADKLVIKRGKALEYYSRHYGKVLVADDRPISVLGALMGINQLIEEETGSSSARPPDSAEPHTRQFLRLFDGKASLPRDQFQKSLRGTGSAPDDFVERGWCVEENRQFTLVSPLVIALSWQKKHRRGMTSDFDQAMFCIGASFDKSGITLMSTLRNDNFRPHPALVPLLNWFATHGYTPEVNTAATRAGSIVDSYIKSLPRDVQQARFYFEKEEVA